MDSVRGIQEGVFLKRVPQQALKGHVEKVVHPQSPILEAKRYSQTRKLKKVVEKSKEDSPTNKKNVVVAKVLDISALRSPVVAQQPLRTSPRK